MAELNKVSVDDLKVTGKRVLVRVDFNVPMKDGVITNDNRIQAALPTINKLTSEGAKVILCSHLGKPKNGPEEKFSLKAAAARLGELVSAKVTFVPSDVVVDDTVKAAVDKMQNGEIIVLENTRFRKGRDQEHRILQQGSGIYRRRIRNGCFRQRSQSTLLYCRRNRIRKGNCCWLSDAEGDQVPGQCC